MIHLKEIQELCFEGESNRLDYKERQYAFENNAPEGAKGELLKDVLAFANSNRLLPAYILIGVEESADKTGKIVGIAKNELLDDAHMQQFVNAKTNRIVSFRVYAVEIAAGLYVQVIEIDARRDERPFYSRKDVGGVVHGNVYMRVGSSTIIASPKQIKEMGLDEAEGKARPVVELSDDANLKRMVVDYITQFGSASRQELNKLLLGKMHEALSEKEKHNKVGNLLAALKNEGGIQADGVTRSAKWVLNTTVFKGENM